MAVNLLEVVQVKQVLGCDSLTSLEVLGGLVAYPSG